MSAQVDFLTSNKSKCESKSSVASFRNTNNADPPNHRERKRVMKSSEALRQPFIAASLAPIPYWSCLSTVATHLNGGRDPS